MSGLGGVIDALLDHVLSRLVGRPVEAFSFATALGLGMEALPIRHRPVTAVALTDRGFLGMDLWRYMCADLPVTGLPRTSYTTSSDGDRLSLTVRASETLLGEATVGPPVQGIGVLWWISVEPAARGRGLGKALLGSALDLLSGLGAKQVILYVDDDEPGVANGTGPSRTGCTRGPGSSRSTGCCPIAARADGRGLLI